VQCTVVQFIVVQCSAVQCTVVQCTVVQCTVVQCTVVQCTVVQCSVVKSDYQIRRNEMVEACNTNGGDQKSIGLWWGNLKVGTTWKN
jgi:galactokinase